MRTWLVSAVLASVFLGGCASGDASDEQLGESPTVPPASSAAADPSSTPTPTTAPDPGVAAATGPELELSEATLRIPEGWKPDPTNTADILVATSQDPVKYESFGVVSLPGGGQPVDAQAAQLIDFNKGRIRYKRMPDTYLGGSPAYLLTGPDQEVRGLWHVAIGGPYGERNYTLSFTLDYKSQAQRAAVVDSVLASWRWK
ncbi:MAG: hypothetical protein H0X12_07545 [Nocardioides sp.]|nr:hypothetical protein [Nocardioides sp.]